MLDIQFITDIQEASESSDYALDIAIRKLKREFGEGNFTSADCVALAAITIAKVNMMHEGDIRYLEMDRLDRHAPRPQTENSKVRK